MTPSASETKSRSRGSSASRTPTRLPGGFTTDDFGEFVPAEVTVIDSSSGLVPVTNANGVTIGTVQLPGNVQGALVVSSDTHAEVIDAVASIVLDVTVVGENGELITEFDDPIELCFNSDESKDDVSLGFYNDDNEWECEDYCLESTDSGVCGETKHLASFALLLDSGAGSSDECGSGSTDYLYVYLSAGAVGLAVITIVVFVVLLEVRVRVKAAQLNESFRSMNRSVNSLSTD
mmetsp:Transcript_3208/g.11201  ORF Transcript_3208/g.11201 Transcript_3208/m.11201 type:complete len:234 (+) Transcript_3208:3763-4464(+)